MVRGSLRGVDRVKAVLFTSMMDEPTVVNEWRMEAVVGLPDIGTRRNNHTELFEIS